jgi:tetratricopeptide (TPR) repeat protein
MKIWLAKGKMGSSSEIPSSGRIQLDNLSRIAVLYATPSAAALALIYALFAGLRTVGDSDLLWQLATGRWMVQHRSIPFTDVFSYTIHGREWIYPVLSQLLFYVAYVLGGYSLLSWVGAAASVVTVAMLVRRGQAPAIVLALLAVPMIAERTNARAEMFTEILFAAFVSILWHYHRSGRGPLCALPVLMCLWVNLHLGFVAGLVMCGAYVFLELGDGVFGDGWEEPLKRLRRAAPWLAATGLATLLNPWGPRLYAAVSRQNDINRFHSHWIKEWFPMRLTRAALADGFAWREPKSAVLWLMAAAVAATLMALSMRRIAPALLLGGSICLASQAIRYQVPFATIAVIIGGSIIADAMAEIGWMRRLWLRVAPGAALAVLVTIALFTCVRIWDLASNRYYMSTPRISYFGPGESSWFPERAAAFLLREHLPSNIFNDYNSGGFLTWALSPTYLDYIDGRSVPFGAELYMRSQNLIRAPLDSALWWEEADRRNINTIILSVDRNIGQSTLSSLKTSCSSQQWRLVYLDTEAALFVRVRPDTLSLIGRLQLDCNTVRFDAPPAATGSRGRAEQFDYYLNAANILMMLDRDRDALEAAERAGHIFQNNPSLHFLKGISLWKTGRVNEAEQELRQAVDLGSLDASISLAEIYRLQGRYADQVSNLEHAADLSVMPESIYLKLGYAQLAIGRPDKALSSFDNAEKASPFVGEAYTYGAGFRQSLAEGRAEARRNLQSK